MNFNTFPKSDMKISEISFGCMSLGDNFKENTYLLHAALDGGINFFDTADLYQAGENERCLGKAFVGRRHKLYLSTKVGNALRPDGSGKWDWNPSPDYIIGAVHQSLKRLQTDYLDLCLLHGGTISDPLAETVAAFEQLKKAGDLRHYGISSIRPNTIAAYTQAGNLTGVMMQYSLLDRRPEEYCLDFLRQNKVGVIARGSIAQGLLAGKTPTDYLNYSEKDVEKASQKIADCALSGRTPLQTALKFVLSHQAVTSVALGIRTKAQLEEVLQTSHSPNLDRQTYETLAAALPPNRYEKHRLEC